MTATASCITSTNRSTLAANAITALYEDKNGTLWIGTVNGLCRKNAEERAAERFLQFQNDPANNGALWVGTMHAGLKKFEAATEKFFTYTWQHPDHQQKYARYLPPVFACIDSLHKT